MAEMKSSLDCLGKMKNKHGASGEKKLEERLLKLMKDDWLGAQSAMWFIVYEDKLFMEKNEMLQRASVGEPLTYSERKFQWKLNNFSYIELDGAYDEIGRAIEKNN